MNKKNEISSISDAINSKCGAGSIQTLGGAVAMNVETVSSGSLEIDIATGGGIPIGRIIEVYGAESSGKTTIALHIAKEFQKAGKTVAFLDVEHALDPEYAKKIGVDVKKILIAQPDSGEEALNIAEELVKQKIGLIIVDSVAALTPRAEIQGEMGASLPGLQARLMSQACRKLTAITGKNKVTIVFINQMRMKIGVMWGDPRTTSGGNALKFYASLRMDVSKRKAIEETSGKTKTAIATPGTVRIVKNKIAPPFRSANIQIKYGVGIDKYNDMVEAGVKMGIIEKAGPYFKLNGEKYLGNENLKSALSDEKVFDKLYEKIRSKIGKTDYSTGEIHE
jgi:recombination protein RecA